MRPTSTTVVSTSTCATLQPDRDTADNNAQLDTAKEGARIQRTFSEIATKPNEGGRDPDVKTASSPKELSGLRMDPHYQEPPQYAEINHHRPSPQRPVEVNEIGPTIQQGVIQCPVQRHTQPADGPRRPTVPVNAQTTSVPSLQVNNNGGTHERDRKQESNPEENGYVINCIHENRPFTVNDVGRPVFVNHYYVGETFIPVTNKRLIKLDECDVSTEISLRNAQPQDIDHEFKEHSQNSQLIQQTAEAEKEQWHTNAIVHSDLREDSQNSLKITSVSRDTEASQKTSNGNRGIHSEFIEHSQKLQGALNIGKSRGQAADQLTTWHIPLTGYENFRQELQTYPVSRDPMTVQLTGVGNESSSAILDLPNVNTNLPPPLLPNPSSHYHQQHHNQAHPTEVSPGQVTNSEILKSIQSITEVMQQQLLLNSKTTEHGIVQTASLFQEMIKAQEKRDLDPAFLAIPTFSGEAKDRPQCLDWVSRVKNICDQSGHSFHQELINKSGILVQNFIRSLSENITNKELTEKILQFFSDVPMTRMHSSRMHTSGSLPYRGCLSRGSSLTETPQTETPWTETPRMETPPGQRPRPPVDRQTPAKT